MSDKRKNEISQRSRGEMETVKSSRSTKDNKDERSTSTSSEEPRLDEYGRTISDKRKNTSPEKPKSSTASAVRRSRSADKSKPAKRARDSRSRSKDRDSRAKTARKDGRSRSADRQKPGVKPVEKRETSGRDAASSGSGSARDSGRDSGRRDSSSGLRDERAAPTTSRDSRDNRDRHDNRPTEVKSDAKSDVKPSSDGREERLTSAKKEKTAEEVNRNKDIIARNLERLIDSKGRTSGGGGGTDRDRDRDRDRESKDRSREPPPRSFKNLVYTPSSSSSSAAAAAGDSRKESDTRKESDASRQSSSSRASDADRARDREREREKAKEREREINRERIREKERARAGSRDDRARSDRRSDRRDEPSSRDSDARRGERSVRGDSRDRDSRAFSGRSDGRGDARDRPRSSRSASRSGAQRSALHSRPPLPPMPPPKPHGAAGDAGENEAKEAESEVVLPAAPCWALELKSILVCKRLAGPDLYAKIRELRHPSTQTTEGGESRSVSAAEGKESVPVGGEGGVSMDVDDLLNELSGGGSALGGASAAEGGHGVDMVLSDVDALLASMADGGEDGAVETAAHVAAADTVATEELLTVSEEQHDEKKDDTAESHNAEDNAADDADDMYGDLTMSGGGEGEEEEEEDDLYGDLTAAPAAEEEEEVAETVHDEETSHVSSGAVSSADQVSATGAVGGMDVQSAVKIESADIFASIDGLLASCEGSKTLSVQQPTSSTAVAVDVKKSKATGRRLARADPAPLRDMPYVLQDLSYARTALYSKAMKGQGFASSFMQALPQIAKLLEA